MLKGIGASAGIGIGRALLVREPDLDYSRVTPAGPEAEQARLAAAVSSFIEKTRAMAQSMESQVGQRQAEIFLGQVMMIEDPFMTGQMNDLIAAGQCAEAALDAEIRRQYPDLKLGPAYANEEGLDRLGFTAGLTVPLWNRNRKNIAEATGVRDETRLKAIDAWRTCVCDAAAAHAALTHLLDHPAVPAAERRTVDALADAGELTPLDYLTVREEILEQQLAEADWRRDASCAKIELSKFQ